MTGPDAQRRAIEREIETAVSAWARSVFAAPRQLGELVTGVECRDEVIERVSTIVVRRELREVRAATGERAITRPRVDLAAVDPFGHTRETLSADSEHVAPCEGCAASGRSPCDRCHASGEGTCPSCHGTGQCPDPQTGRPAQCGSCGASGTAPCRGCAGDGRIPCDACTGSGHQRAWWTFDETQRCEIAVPAASPMVAAHHVLREPRALSRRELTGLVIVAEQVRLGPLDLGELEASARAVVSRELGPIDPRLERVHHQQYLKLASPRRAATFEMCGARATLSLSGSQLIGQTTPEVMRPIKRRLYGWCVLSALVGLAALGIRGATVGSSSYFDGVRGLSGWLVAASVGCAIPVIGAALRSWRGDWRFHPVPWPIKLCAAASAAALISLVGVGLAVSPDLADGQRALAANDIAAARSTVEALEEQVGETREVMDLEDRVTVAEANQRVGEPRLKLLDAVAARNGAAAAGAALEARELRLEQIRELIAWHRPSEALAVLDGALSRDPGAAVAEERARAHDAAIALCGTAACRLGEATHALAAHATPARDQAVRLARDQAAAAIDLARLAHRPRGATAVLRRLQELRRVRDAAAAIAELALDDPALIASARKAVGVVAAERAAVPLLGNPREIAEELLGAATPDRVPAIELDGTTIYLALDRDGRCRGIRAIGDRQLERALASSTWPPGRLVSQAFGKPMTVASPPSGESIVRWSADGTPIVARWWDHALVELQIGDATTRRLTP